jgi:hypothetical protein
MCTLILCVWGGLLSAQGSGQQQVSAAFFHGFFLKKKTVFVSVGPGHWQAKSEELPWVIERGMEEARATLARLGVRSIQDDQLREILSSVGSGSGSSPGSAPSTSGDFSEHQDSSDRSGGSVSMGGSGGGGGSGTSSMMDDGLSLPSELLAELASPAPAWRGVGGGRKAGGILAVGGGVAPDLRAECVEGGICLLLFGPLSPPAPCTLTHVCAAPP